jgi:GAF domain-containing protein
MSRALTAQLNVDAVIESIHRYASRLMDATNLYVALYDPEQDEVSFPLHIAGETIQRGLEGRRGGKGLTEHVIRTREPLLIKENVTARVNELGLESTTEQKAQSWLGVPMMIGDQVLGVIAVQSYTTERLYNEHHRDLLRAVASQAAIAIQNAHLFEQTQARAEELVVLNELGQTLTARLNVNQVLEETYKGVSRLIDTPNFYIGLYDPAEDKIAIALNVTESQVDREIVVIPADQGISGHILRTRRPVLIRDDVAGWQAETGLQIVGQTAASWLGVPLLLGDQPWGLMAVQSYTTPRAYDEHDRDLLMAIGSQVAIAIQNARLFEEQSKRVTQLTLLNAVMGKAAAILNLELLLEVTTESIQRSFNYYHVGAFLVDTGTKELVLQAAVSGFGEAIPKGYRQAIGVGMIGRAAETGQTQLADDTSQNPDYIPVGEWAPLSEMSVPIKVGDTVVGVLDVESDRRYAFTEVDVLTMETLASQLAAGMENIRLFEQEQRRRQETEALRQASLTLGSTLNVDQVLDELLDQIGQVIPYDSANAMWVEEGIARVTHQRGYERTGTADATGELRLPVDQIPTLRRMFSTHRPHLVPDTWSDPDWARLEPTLWIRSWIGAPILARDEVVGFLSLDSETPGFYTSEQAGLLAAFAAHAAIAVENARLFGQEQHARFLTELRVRELDCLSDIGRRIGEAPPLPEFMEWVAGRIPAAMQFPDVCAAAIEFEWQIYGAAEATKLPCQMVQGLRIGGDLVGQVYVAYTDAHDFLDEESALLGDITRRVSGYIESRRLFQQTQAALAETEARVREMQILQQVSQAISATLDLDRILDALVDVLSQKMGFTFIALSLVDETANALHTVRAVGLAQGLEGLTRTLEQLRNDILIDVIRTRRTEVIDGWDERFDREIYEREGHEALVRAFTPLQLREKTLGVLEVGYRRAERARITDSEVQLLRSLTDQVAVVIENVRLFDQARQASALLSGRVRELDCLNDIGRKIDETPSVPEFLQWAAKRLPLAMQHPDVCVVAIEFGDQVYGAPEALNSPYQIVQGLRIGGKAVGQVYIAYTEQREFPDTMSALLGDIVRRMSGYLENRRLFEETSQRTAELQALYETSLRLGTELEPSELLRLIVEQAVALVGAETGGFYLYHPQSDELVFSVAVGYFTEFIDNRLKPGEGLAGQVFQSRRAQTVEEYRTWPGQAEPYAGESRITSILGVPLVGRAGVLGVLDIGGGERKRTFSERDIRLAELFAAQAATTLENARLFGQTQAALAETETLYRTTSRLVTATSMQEVVTAVVDALRAMGAEAGMMGLFEPHGAQKPDAIWFLRSWRQDGTAPFPPDTHLPASASPLPIERLRTLWVVPDIAQAPDLPERARALLEREGMHATAAIPLRVGEQVTGFVAVYHATSVPFSEASLRIYETLSAQAAVALESQRLLAETERRARREQLLREITAHVRGSTDPDAIMRAAVRELGSALGRPAFVRLGSAEELAQARGGGE